MDEQYPSNSRTKVQTEGSKNVTDKPEKKVERIVTSPVARRKKPLGKRFAETFGGGDAQSVMSYVAMEVLLPAAKDAVSDAVSQGIEKMLFGEARGGGRSRVDNRRRPAGGNTSYTSYNRVSQANTRPDPRQQVSQRARATHDFDEIILDSRADAQSVIEQLFSLVEDYEVATVADLYEMVGQSANYTDAKWGWVDMRGATVSRVRGGWLLDLPKPEVIN